MTPFISRACALLALSTAALAQDEPRGDGYFGYNLERRGDNESAVYETANTKTGIDTLNPIPDVYLNASVSVGEISIEVKNITAKVNLDAKVLNLLHFQAGVDASIDRVKLGIYNVSAKVELEARLENVVKMVDDVLTSIDLNPIIATLGDGVSDIVNKTVDAITDEDDEASAVAKRDLTYRIENGILYSVHDFEGRRHTNRVLAQNGSMFDVFLNNNGEETGRRVAGYYSRDMTFSGHNRTIAVDGQVKEFELQYIYAPYPGLEAFSNIYVDTTGTVVRTKIVAEAEGGGTATISNDSE
ncbi:hypothetical protein CMUS01_11455 [Colletotrichum musicola]|uniref:Uncharacterized protein n=1 Tax=Colletotrichum musicola TaxID=2175873 RepID=A0A8H6JX76_9PEZI|nr:hypothetical protein CMUS01_11455 [Colletotrichum musicola]